MQSIEVQDYKGHTIKLFTDPDPENPRNWDNLGTMVCWHRSYKLGDEHAFPESQAFLASQERRDAYVILPLYLLDHSGLAMRTRNFHDCDPGAWDSGQVGWIYVTKEKAEAEYGRLCRFVEAKVEQYLETEVKTYSLYLEGGFVGYEIEGPSSDDSCWSFEDSDYCLKEARSVIDHAIASDQRMLAAHHGIEPWVP